jgi:hypothetical protein
MDDTFIEKIVRQRKNTQDYLKVAGLAVAAVVLILAIFYFSNYLGIFMPVLIVGVGYGLWYLLQNFNREFEYSVTNGDLDIDVIFSRRKRKRFFSGSARQFEIMGPISGDEYREALKGKYKLLDCSAFPDAKDNWFILTEFGGERVMVLFAPDERMLKQLKRYNPSKIRFTEYGR